MLVTVLPQAFVQSPEVLALMHVQLTRAAAAVLRVQTASLPTAVLKLGVHMQNVVAPTALFCDVDELLRSQLWSLLCVVTYQGKGCWLAKHVIAQELQR